MIRISYFFYSTCFSLFLHYLIVSYFQEIKDKEKEIFIVELSKFQKFSPQINAPVIKTREEKKKLKHQEKKRKKKKLLKKRLIKRFLQKKLKIK